MVGVVGVHDLVSALVDELVDGNVLAVERVGWFTEPIVAQDYATALDLVGQERQLLSRLVIAVGRIQVHPVEKAVRKRLQHGLVKPNVYYNALARDVVSEPIANVCEGLLSGFAACRPLPFVTEQVPRVDEV